MKKSVFSCLKIALIIFLIGADSLVFANPDFQIQPQLESLQQDFAYKSTDNLPKASIESKIVFSVDSTSNFKRTGGFQAFDSNYNTSKIVDRTHRLLYNFGHFIVPSLGITKIIFPFHSFL